MPSPDASGTVRPGSPLDSLLTTRPRSCRTLIGLALLLALGFRAAALDAYGFSEDEAAKLRAVADYRRGNFSVNAEHPMLMKLAIWGSLSAAERWNRLAPQMQVSPESAVRLPNVLAGTATVAALYAAVALLSGATVGLVAAFIVALDPNVTAVNRLGKEDTFLVLFLMAAIFCYEKAKRTGESDPARAQPWYTASGAAFGLMLASKYMPQWLGVYALFNVVAVPNAGANKPRKAAYYGAMAMAFLVANLAILLPSTWAYIGGYVSGSSTMHHGYFYDGELFVNSGTSLLNGVPITYYLKLMWTKIPLVVLAAALAGIVPLVRRRHERGYIWMRVTLIAPLIGYSLVASKFQRYALPMLVAVDVIAAAGVVWAAEWVWRQQWPEARRAVVLRGAFLVLIVGLAAVQWRALPFYSVHQNVIAAAIAPPASVFPEESYDYGVREAVQAIAAVAGPDATIVSDASIAVQHYVERSGRRDMAARSLSRDGLGTSGERWVLVQDAHVYFENASIIAQLRRHPVWKEYRIRGATVLQVFRLDR